MPDASEPRRMEEGTGAPDNVESLWLHVDGNEEANRCILRDCGQ